jgi:hypothetical protein
VLTGSLDLLCLLVLVLGVIKYAANGRLRIGCDLDKVKVVVLREGKSVWSLKNAYLLTIRSDQPNLRDANAFINPSLVPVWETTIEPLRDSH